MKVSGTWIAGLAALALSLSACGTIQRPSEVVRLEDAALVPAADPRILADDSVQLKAHADSVQARLAQRGTVTMLALSGGGANGAYGAGVLVGWSQRGDRPKFDVVTGVSTGALAAPFAFLGPEWDDELREAYTDGAATDLVSWRSFAAFLNPSLFSSRVLRDLVDANVTPELLRAIAREHAGGRQLLVATTDLDTQQTVIWDMGLLATQGDDNAVRLFKDVLVASASIPGVFPPVFISAREDDGRIVTHMHVDGGVNTPFLAIPEQMMLWTREGDARRPAGSLYVIVNGQAGRTELVTAGRLSGILVRSYDSMSKASLRMHLAMTKAFARRNGLGLSMTAVPDNVVASGLKFDPETMQALFELGRSRGADGSAWTDVGDAPVEAPLIPRNEISPEAIPAALEPQPAPGQPPLAQPAPEPES